MKKKKIGLGCLLLLGGMIGCGLREEERSFPDPEKSEDNREFRFALAAQETIDSAQILFFQKRALADTLLARETVYHITQEPHQVSFQMPAGQYEIIILGNVSPQAIVARPPYSSDSVWVAYPHSQPPVVGLGRSYVNVGTDTLRYLGMMLLTSKVELTIQEVPAAVKRIEVELENTGVGMYLKSGYIPQAVTPPLKIVLEDLRAASSYPVLFSCFPGVVGDRKSRLNVTAYDIKGTVIYAGHSAPFEAHNGRKWNISCSFRAAMVSGGRKDKHTRYPIENWKYVEVDL